MSQSLMELIEAYGSARATWMAGGSNHVPETLAAVKARIAEIRDAAIQIGVDGETIWALLDGTE
jgi:hypothetical protein